LSGSPAVRPVQWWGAPTVSLRGGWRSSELEARHTRVLLRYQVASTASLLQLEVQKSELLSPTRGRSRRRNLRETEERYKCKAPSNTTHRRSGKSVQCTACARECRSGRRESRAALERAVGHLTSESDRAVRGRGLFSGRGRENVATFEQTSSTQKDSRPPLSSVDSLSRFDLPNAVCVALAYLASQN